MKQKRAGGGGGGGREGVELHISCRISGIFGGCQKGLCGMCRMGEEHAKGTGGKKSICI